MKSIIFHIDVNSAFLSWEAVYRIAHRGGTLDLREIPSPTDCAEQIKNRIRDELGFTVNIGISHNKFLAKMASDFKKPDRVHTLYPEEIQEKMWPLPVSDLFFVGRATTKKLFAVGIKTIGELAKTDPVWLKSILKKQGEIIWGFANGIDLWLKERGLTGVRLVIGDKNLGMLETIPEVFPDARYQRCTVHFYRNIFSVTPRNKMKAVAMMLKAIHEQESKEAARAKAVQVADKLREMKLGSAAKKLENGIEETLTYMDFPTQHWTRIRTNNTIERLNREIKRRTKAIGAFPDGQSALMLVCARLRHVAGTQWGTRRYMNMDHLTKPEEDLPSDSITG